MKMPGKSMLVGGEAPAGSTRGRILAGAFYLPAITNQVALNYAGFLCLTGQGPGPLN